jgi:AhpD family alkylhydroperoxidase
VGPLPADLWDDDVRRALSPMLPAERRNPDGAGPALSTLARHPDLAKAFLTFSVYLTYRSTLPPRVRETAILRVAHRTGCAYEWVHHVGFGKEAGLTDEDIAAIRQGHLIERLESAVVRAVDELDEAASVSDDTWAELGEFLDERQRMDLVFTIGGYRVLATAFNTFGVLPEQEN